MKIVGIIAEYNPFHNGHAYQINKIKELTGADYVVIAMSGDYVQRGAPAIMDKYARTKMALSCGADLVIELPVLWAASSAESFAMAGVTLFDKMGCIDTICFGAESDHLALLSHIADILADEPEHYREKLSSYLKDGFNFPLARSKALADLAEEGLLPLDPPFPSADVLTDILNNPNNILAIEYLKALKRRNSSITPVLLKREGTGYHDTAITHAADNTDNSSVFDNNGISNGITASATAIRNALSTGCLLKLKHTMPEAAFAILSEYCNETPLLTQDDFSPQLAYRLLFAAASPTHGGSDGHAFSNFCDSNVDISNRIVKNRNQFLSFSQFCELNKSRDITYTRMSRILLHILLGLTNEDLLLGKEIDYIPYLRLLGFRKSSTALLSEIKRCANVPMISKLSDAETILDENAMHLLKQDIFAAELYEQVLSNKKKTIPRSEYTREIVRL